MIAQHTQALLPGLPVASADVADTDWLWVAAGS
jgi:hypothetical protein